MGARNSTTKSTDEGEAGIVGTQELELMTECSPTPPPPDAETMEGTWMLCSTELNELIFLVCSGHQTQ